LYFVALLLFSTGLLIKRKFTMSNSTTAVAAVAAVAVPAVNPAAVKVAEVTTLILDAGKAASTMLSCCKDAAKIASKQLDATLALAPRIAQVTALYAEEFKTAGHNVKSLFVDALTLHAAETCAISIETIGTDGKRVETQTTAGAAVDLPKHAMREAAKQVREVHGMGRKRAEKTAANPVALQAAPDIIKTETDRFSDWLDQSDAFITDSVFHAKIVAHFITLGFSLNKAVKGRKIVGV
jgi:hypothetical protein